MKKLLASMIVIAVIILVGIFVWPKPFGDHGVLCTQDAKFCTDGSYVGRVAPACEFAACPTGVPASWKVYSDSDLGLSFQYPDTLQAHYISTSTEGWPPTIQVSSDAFSCDQTTTINAGKPTIVRRTVDNRSYCVQTQNEGAAGSTYSTYVYKTVIQDKVVSLTFTLRYPQCANYDNPAQTECTNEREAFDLDSLVDRMIGTVKFE